MRAESTRANRPCPIRPRDAGHPPCRWRPSLDVLRSAPVRRGFFLGALAGGLLALGLGWSIAQLPTTPTWALWRIKSALDDDDLAALRARVDLTAVATRAIGEIGSPAGEGPASGIDLKEIGLALLSGGKLLTVFNDPERPLRLDAADFLAAWWNMRRDGDLAYLSLPADGREIALVLGRGSDDEWRVVGVTPLSALIRVKQGKPSGEPRAAAPANR